MFWFLFFRFETGLEFPYDKIIISNCYPEAIAEGSLNASRVFLGDPSLCSG